MASKFFCNTRISFFNTELHFTSKLHTDGTLTFWDHIINAFTDNSLSLHHFCAFTHIAS